MAADIAAIKKAAAERGQKMHLPYAGALLPAEAHTLMEAGVKLVDIRTEPELAYVGSIPGAEFVEWQLYPRGTNPNFLAELEAVAPKDGPVMFICRSGNRSHHTAILATQAGWRECYNVLEGFEGHKDAEGHRGTVDGWRKAGLPWTQG